MNKKVKNLQLWNCEVNYVQATRDAKMMDDAGALCDCLFVKEMVVH